MPRLDNRGTVGGGIRAEPSRDFRRRTIRPAIAGGKSLPFHVHDADVVFAAGCIRGIDQSLHHLIGLARKAVDDVVHRRRVDQVGEAVAAEKQRGIRLERNLAHVDEVRIVRLVGVRTDVAIHLVAPRVVHRLELGELVGIFALANRRVIAGDFVDAIVPQLVQPRVADVADNRARLVHDHDREDARHAIPLRPQPGSAMDLVVRDRDGFPHPIDHRPRLPFQPRPHHCQRDVGGLSAGRVAADAVDDHEQASRHVDVDAIFVDVPLQARVGVGRGSERARYPHRLIHSALRER